MKLASRLWPFAPFAPLEPHERLVTRAAAAQLAPAARARFERQLRAVARVRRLAEQSEIAFELRELDARDRFINDEPELVLATICLDTPTLPVRAELCLDGGLLAAILFQRSEAEWEARAARVASVSIWEDPMSEPPQRRAPDRGAVQAWLGDLAPGPLQECLGPLPEPVAQRRIAKLGCLVPDDWRALHASTGGFRAGALRVFGASNARSVTRPGQDWVVLAEAFDQTLLVLDRLAADGCLYALDFTWRTCTPLGNSLRAALEICARCARR